MNFMGVRKADPGGQKSKVGGQRNKVGGQKNKVGGQKNKVGGQKNKGGVKKTRWGVKKTRAPLPIPPSNRCSHLNPSWFVTPGPQLGALLIVLVREGAALTVPGGLTNDDMVTGCQLIESYQVLHSPKIT